MKPAEIAELYSGIAALHDIRLSHITIKASVDMNHEHNGWIFPGGYIIKNTEKALKLANELNKRIKND